MTHLSLAVLLYCVVAALTLIVALRAYVKRSWRRRRSSWPRDTVIVHQVARGPRAPSLSPFPLKLETFLRMARIPYQTDITMERSSKGKFPWISYNDVDVADSQFSIEFCKTLYNVDVNGHLSDEQRATARAFQKMTEENLYWTMCAEIFGRDLSALCRLLPYPRLVSLCSAWLLRGVIQLELWGHGIGRHTRDETRSIARDDMAALSTLLGERAYMLGSEPCELDCAVFGMLAQCRWHMDGSPHQRWITEDFPNLYDYCDRMKTRYWPDWDDVIGHKPIKG